MPWAAIPHADRCLVEGGRVCTFSPCIEQIDRTATELRRGGRYCDIRMFETLAVNWGVRAETQPRKRHRQAAGRSGEGGGAAEEAKQSSEEKVSAADGTQQQEQQPNWLSFQMPMRSHTGYLLVATRSLA